MKAIDAVLGQPWAIMPEWLSMISAIAQRQFDAPVVAAAQGNRARSGTPGLAVKDGVAVIGIIGPIFPRANMMTEMSGATSLAMVQGQFRAALGNPDVRSIVLQIDSPGGVVTGIADFAAEVAAARSLKPIVAVATGDVASAAYWIGSAASSLVVSASALVGSIGIVAGMSKQVLPDANGEVTVEIVSSNAPNKRPDPTDSAGKTSILGMLDALEHQFIAAAARNRGTTQAAVKSDFGQGGVMVGSAAVKAGMADRVGTLDSVLAGLVAASPAYSPGTRAAATASSEKDSMSDHTSVAELTAAYPELVASIRRDATAGITPSADALAAARAEGATAERDRLAGIEAAALPGHEALIAACKADLACAPGDAALKVNAAERAKLNAASEAIRNVETQTGKVGAAAAATRTDTAKSAATIMADTSRPLDERCKEAFDADEKIRTEHGTLGRFIAWTNASEKGLLRVLHR